MPRPLKKLLQITGATVLAVSLSLFGSQKAFAEGSFNLLTLCDRSCSAGEFSCTPDAIKEAGRLWLEKADEAGGGVFELFLIDKGFDSTNIFLSQSYPERFPGPVTAHKKKWKNDFMQRLSEQTKNLPADKGSAIIEAIYRSSLKIPAEGETVIYIMSDMREVNEVFNFERQVPSEKTFSRWLDVKAIKPKFKGTTRFVVCGLHPYTPSDTSRMTTENYARLLKLWQAVFRKWGIEATIKEACGLNN